MAGDEVDPIHHRWVAATVHRGSRGRGRLGQPLRISIIKCLRLVPSALSAPLPPLVSV